MGTHIGRLRFGRHHLFGSSSLISAAHSDFFGLQGAGDNLVASKLASLHFSFLSGRVGSVAFRLSLHHCPSLLGGVLDILSLFREAAFQLVLIPVQYSRFSSLMTGRI